MTALKLSFLVNENRLLFFFVFFFGVDSVTEG